MIARTMVDGEPATLCASADRTLLVVQPDSADRTCVHEALQERGYRVVEADSREAVTAAISGADVTLVFIDLDSWEIDPLGVIGDIRQTHADLPILLAGADSSAPLVELALDMGANDFTPRSIDWPLACRRIQNLIRAAQDARALEEARDTLTLTQQLGVTGLWRWMPERDEMEWSDGVGLLLGVDSPRGRQRGLNRLRDLLSAPDREKLDEVLSEALQTGSTFQFEHNVADGDAGPRYIRHSGVVRIREENAEASVVAAIRDVSNERVAQQQTSFFADHDPLTGLPNRRRFLQRLERVIAAAEKQGHYAALLYIDLDDFKIVNDTLGHTSGDEYLREVSRRLHDCVRESDAMCRISAADSNNSVSRIGGDEFTVLLTRIARETDAGDVAERMLGALCAPFSFEGQEIRSAASIGIALYPEDGPGSEALIRNADAAMYQAKRNGGNRFQFYCRSIDADRLDRLTLERRLRRAIENKELDVHYQPRIELASGEICAVEALARWTDEELGRVPPNRFIPLAEETGLISPLGEWVMKTACAQNLAWRRAGLPPINVSVNVSTKQFVGADFLSVVAEILKRTRLEPSALELEITESAMMQDDELTIRMLRDLQTAGVRIALDDFGTGYSSLSYLTQFPLDCLKLDRSFVKNVHADPAAADLTGAVIDMAHSLNLRVVAEGIDCEAQVEFLRERSCDEIQGFFMAAPMKADSITELLAKQSPRVR